MHQRILNRLSAVLAKLEIVPCIKRSAGIAQFTGPRLQVMKQRIEIGVSDFRISIAVVGLIKETGILD
jgi:hypothetical protein